jgi:hypothetical protein
MQAFGVWSAVLLGTLLLLGGALLAERPRLPGALALLLVAALGLAAGHADRQRIDTAYADYAVQGVERDTMLDPRAFLVNNQHASLIDASTPPRHAAYIEHLRRILLDDHAFAGRDILVLGAGGFTLSQGEPRNRYTYVDIDPAIRAIAERDFLGAPINGRFIAADARRHVASTTERHDAIVVDVYSALTAIPGHLVTREFWLDTRRALKPDGILLANLILDGALASPYARNLLATVESAYGRCAVEVLRKSAPLSNVIVSCAAREAAVPTLYVDERSRADLDNARTP